MVESTAAALLSALLFAVTTNLQRVSASSVHQGHGPLRLLGHLVTDPRWLLGGAVGIAAFALHGLALSRGSVTVVQAIMAVGLVLVLWIEAARERRMLRRRELAGALLIVSGVSLVVACGTGHVRGVASPRSLLVGLAVVALAVVAVLASRSGVDARRGARMLAGLAGACFAVDAVFLQRLASLVDRPAPLGAVLGADPLALGLDVFAFAAASVVGTVSIHRAYQVAPLREVQPALASAEPVTAFVLGVAVLGEGVRWGAVGYLVAVAGLAMLTVGILVGLGGRTTEPAGAAEDAEAAEGAAMAGDAVPAKAVLAPELTSAA